VTQCMSVEDGGRKAGRGWLGSALSAALCLSFSPLISAADSSSGQVSLAPARTALPGCAKLVCQRRAPALDGAQRKQGGPQRAWPLRVRFGLGAGGFSAPVAPFGVYPAQDWADARPGDGEEKTYRPEISGATVSLGVSLEQELSDAAGWRWGIEERLSLVTVVPVDGRSVAAIGGVADLLLSGCESGLPLRAALGPSLAVAQLHVDDEDISLDHPAVFVGAAASIRWDATALMALDLTGHLGKSLNYEGDAAYRDLQLTVSVGL
jgi:hypothetical protein